MEKVSAMKKVALFLMTKRVARPMKFAAFISIIISVAVMFAACQGAVGPQGPKGDPGTDGAPGTAGTPGTPGSSGTNALSAKPNSPAIMINDVKEDGSDVIGALPGDLNAASYFRGGKEPVKFTRARRQLERR